MSASTITSLYLRRTKTKHMSTVCIVHVSAVTICWDGVCVQELTTGSIMNFIMSTEGCLGPLTFLRIWHDNSGIGKLKGWFLDQIQITDLQTGEKYATLRHFIVSVAG